MAARDVVLIGVLIAVFAIGFFVMHFVVGAVTDKMLLNPTINASTNAKTAIQDSVTLSNRMDYVVFALFIGLTLSLIITGYFIGGEPIFMFIYFVVVVLGVVIASVLANVWEQISQTPQLVSSLSSFPISNNLLSNLPLYVAIIGFIGLIVMFAKPYVQSE